MPVSFNHIITNAAEVTFSWQEDTITIAYYPGKITEKTIAELKTLANMKQDIESVVAGYTALNAVLVQLIKTWDVYEDEEQTVIFPITMERLPELPLLFRAAVAKAILGDLRPEALASQEKI